MTDNFVHCAGNFIQYNFVPSLDEVNYVVQKLLKWFTQLLLAVEYLHSNYVLHRDLKVCKNC